MRQFRLPRDSSDWPVQVTRFGAVQTFTISATGVVFATGPTRTSVARVWATIPCHILFEKSATEAGATTSSTPVGPEVAEYVGLNPGDFLSAVLASTGTATTGTIWVTEAA
jgi:hypothetical protein